MPRNLHYKNANVFSSMCIKQGRPRGMQASSLPCAQGAPSSPPQGPPATPSPVVLSLQQLKLVFDAVAGVRGGEFELLG